MKYKDYLITVIGVGGGTIVKYLGGWDNPLKALLIFMGIDWISGCLVAGVFKNSDKSEDGSLNSNAGYKGLCRKGMMLLFVLVGAVLDMVIGSDFIRNSVVIAFIANELLSIIENAGNMGLPIPKVIINAVEVLKKTAGEITDKEEDKDED